MLKYTEFEFRTNDGADLFAREWQPEDIQLRGVIILLHGLGEHSGRYANMALKFTQAGYILSTYDQRGHGNSPGRRGHTPSYEILLDDIDCFRQQTLKRFPDLPAFLYGHSMGGNLVLNYVIRRLPKFSGVIVTGPWLKLTVQLPAFIRAFVRFLSKLWPTFSLSNGLELNALSHDPSVVKAYELDPLVHKKISVRLFTAMDQAGRWAMKNVVQFNLPLLLMHGGGDRITSPEASVRFAGCVQKDCTLKIWQDLYHELHNEIEKEEIIAFIINWLELQVSSGD